MWKVFNDKTAKEICYGCGSDISKQTYAYFRTALFYNADKVMSEIYDGKALYFATRAKNHIRLIEIAVLSEYQGGGHWENSFIPTTDESQGIGDNPNHPAHTDK